MRRDEHGDWPDVPCKECGETPDSPSAYRHAVCLVSGTERSQRRAERLAEERRAS